MIHVSWKKEILKKFKCKNSTELWNMNSFMCMYLVHLRFYYT